MAVPLGPGELASKIEANFVSIATPISLSASSHRETAETDDINRSTAEAYDAVGMAEYEAIEAFKEISIAALQGA